MSNALDDITLVLEYLMMQKTATGPVAEALDRLRNRSHTIPADVKLIDPPELRGPKT